VGSHEKGGWTCFLEGGGQVGGGANVEELVFHAEVGDAAHEEGGDALEVFDNFLLWIRCAMIKGKVVRTGQFSK